MTEWLLIAVIMVNGRIDALQSARTPTIEACEAAGAAIKPTQRRKITFTCVEVAKLRGARR